MPTRYDISLQTWRDYEALNGIIEGNLPNAELTAIKNIPVVNTAYWPIPAYPNLPAIPFLSAYLLVDDADEKDHWINLVATQMNYAHACEKGSGLLRVGKSTTPASTMDKNPAYIHRDLQARQIINWYIAYTCRPDAEYLRRAVICADEMARNIPRGPPGEVKDPDHPGLIVGLGKVDPTFGLGRYAGYQVKLFADDFVKIADTDLVPLPLPPTYSIDGNVCAQGGLAFALLASDPASADNFQALVPGCKLTRSECQEIAMHETMASMTCQIQGTGEILDASKYPNCFYPDTMYGAVTACCWVWVHRLNIYGDTYGSDYSFLMPQFNACIERASNWLQPRMSFVNGRDDYRHNMIRCKMSTEYVDRLPLYWQTNAQGIDVFVDEMFQWIRKLPSNDQQRKEQLLAPWAIYHAMGFTDYRQRLGL